MVPASAARPAFQPRPIERRGPDRLAATVRPAAIPAGTANPVPADALADALLTAWTAAHHHAAAVWATLNGRPSREAMDAYCDSVAAFAAVSILAETLSVELRIGEALCRHAPPWTRHSIRTEGGT